MNETELQCGFVSIKMDGGPSAVTSPLSKK